MLRRIGMNWIIGLVLALVVITGGLFLLSGGQFLVLDYTDFPQDKLEKLITDISPGTLAISGPSQVEGRSSMTRWARTLLPGTFFVDVSINGRKASLVLDTGAAQTFLSPSLAVAAEVLVASSRLTVQHGWRELPVYLGHVQELEINGLKIENVPVIVGGKQPVVKLVGLSVWNLDGILGMKPLQRLVLTLDYTRGVAVLYRQSPHTQEPSASLQIIKEPGSGNLEHPKPIVECLVNNSGPYSCFIDTGTSAPVFVPRAIWQALGLEGQRQSRLEIKLGELELKEVPAIRANVKYITIGSNIFQAQEFKHVTLDFLAGKLYAER